LAKYLPIDTLHPRTHIVGVTTSEVADRATLRNGIMARDEEAPGGSEHAAHEVTITVNNRTVEMTQGQHTGGDVKDAAITAGQPVTRDFVLTELHGKGQPRKTIGNDDPVLIHEKSEFSLVADDDDS
jgi:hypothetical protein